MKPNGTALSTDEDPETARSVELGLVVRPLSRVQPQDDGQHHEQVQHVHGDRHLLLQKSQD